MVHPLALGIGSSSYFGLSDLDQAGTWKRNSAPFFQRPAPPALITLMERRKNRALIFVFKESSYSSFGRTRRMACARVEYFIPLPKVLIHSLPKRKGPRLHRRHSGLIAQPRVLVRQRPQSMRGRLIFHGIHCTLFSMYVFVHHLIVSSPHP